MIVRRKNKNTRRLINRLQLPTLLFSLVLSSILLFGSTLSWFTSTDTVENTLLSGQYDFNISAVDEFPPITSIPPGGTAQKQVGAKNEGELRGFARLLILPTIVAADGTILAARLGQEVILTDLNQADWAHGNDGYYYYLGVLAPGETAPMLFTEVALKEDLGTAYDNARLKIEVKCEAIDTEQWNYRESWWGDDGVPTDPALITIDDVLSPLSQA